MQQGIKTIVEVAALIGVSRGQIEQWIGRKQFFTNVSTVPGKAREWDFAEVLRLAVFVDLVNLGMPPASAGLATMFTIETFKDEDAIFVAWQGVTKAHPIGGAPGELVDHYSPNSWYPKSLTKDELGAFLSSRNVFRSVVLNAGAIEEALDRDWQVELPTSIWDRA